MKQFAYFAPKIRGNQMYYQPLCCPYLTKPHLIASSERFQVNMTINARVKAVQTFKFFYSFILQPCCPPAYFPIQHNGNFYNFFGH